MTEEDLQIPEEETLEESIEEGEGGESESKIGALTNPEGIMMLIVGIILDLIIWICLILVLLFGIGLLAAKIVYFFGLFLIMAWAFMRGGSVPLPKKGGGKLGERMTGYLSGFIKRHWKKKIIGLIPIIGDLIPHNTWIIYSELTKGAA